jgi:PAS domain S-box-containing protein
VRKKNLRVEDEAMKKNSETALRRSEENLRGAEKIGRSGHFEIDVRTRAVSWSEEIYRIFGLDPLVFTPALDRNSKLVVPEDAVEVYKEIENCLKGKSTFDMIYRILRSDGAVRIVHSLGELRGDDEGLPKTLFGTIQDITEAEEARRSLQMGADIFAARSSLLQYSFDHTLDELLEETLNRVCGLTKSSIGFYHFLEADQKTITLKAWSTETFQDCLIKEKTLHYDISKAGIWVDCIREGRAVIHNDYMGSPGKKGLPPGHISVNRELVVPVFRGV